MLTIFIIYSCIMFTTGKEYNPSRAVKLVAKVSHCGSFRPEAVAVSNSTETSFVDWKWVSNGFKVLLDHNVCSLYS